MDITIRPQTPQERLYSYTQSSQIGSQTGNIGHLRAYYGENGSTFYSTWFDFREDLKTDEFKAELDDVISEFLVNEDPERAFLDTRTSLSRFCFSHPKAADPDFQNFFFREDTTNHAYLFRLNPNRGEYCCYCYCYRRDWLDHHMQEAERGIKFMDRNYNELFRLRDGAKIRVTFPDGEVQENVCRYIDSTHFEYGFGALSVLHIMQFAEWMAEANAKYEPVNEADIVQTRQKKRTDLGRE